MYCISQSNEAPCIWVSFSYKDKLEIPSIYSDLALYPTVPTFNDP